MVGAGAAGLGAAVELQANGHDVLVIDPAGTGTFELRKMIELFCENPHRACCESLQSALG